MERTGYTLPVVEYALDSLFFSIDRTALEDTIADELGSLAALDGFTPRTGRPDAHARPAGRVCIVSSRTTIGVAIVPAIFALCAKCDVVVKDREDGLVRAFFLTFAQELDAFPNAARAQAWDGESEGTDLAEFDAVVAFGSDDTLVRIRQRTSANAAFVGYGAKASVGYAGRDALTAENLRSFTDAAARDLVLYETEGCMSLHVLFIERDGNVKPQEVARAIASAVERAAVEFPPGLRDAAAGARILSARNLAAFRSAAGSGAVFSDKTASYIAVLDPPFDEPPALLPRTLAVRTVDSPADALDYVRAHALPVEAVAIAGTRDDIVNMALDMQANRMTSFGALQRPPLAGGHGGHPRIGNFVRWVTREV